MRRVSKTSGYLKSAAPWVLLLSGVIAGEAQAADAVVRQVKGKGEVREGSNVWKAAQIEQPVNVVASLRTGEQSAMGLLLADKSQLNLGANCEIALMEVRTAKASDSLIKAQRCTQLAGQRKESGKTRIQGPNDTTADVTGTEWVMEIGDATVMTVLNGTVELANPHGKVILGANEQGRAEPGKAPVKMLLLNPRERVQWVNHLQVSREHYAELRQPPTLLQPALAALDEQRLGEARALLERAAAQPDAPVVASLLLADFAVSAGEFALAEATLQAAASRHRDVRIGAKRVAVALLADRLTDAGQILAAAQRDFPDHPELHLAAGQLARLQGQAPATLAAYRRAIDLQPADPRGYFGLGSAEAERERLAPARRNLLEALRLGEAPGYRGELAILETFADHLDTAREQFRLALARYPNDYIALAGLGLLELKAGHSDAALEHLLAAQLIEPRHARTQVYIAVAYYQRGRPDAALLMLGRAGELDRNDPLPHQIAALIHQDGWNFAAALRESRLALAKLPYLKSLNQLALNQRGSANLGSTLSLLGLDDWAQHHLAIGYSPFWAGSSLFLADRVNEPWLKNSALLQGYLADPTVFGASPRFNSLVRRPGDYFSAGLRFGQSDSLRHSQAFVVANGQRSEPFPLSYFVDWAPTRLAGRANGMALEHDNATVALGAKPGEAVRLFGLIDRQQLTGDFREVSMGLLRSDVQLLDRRQEIGINLGVPAERQLWLKAAHQTSDTALRGEQTCAAVDCAFWQTYLGVVPGPTAGLQMNSRWVSQDQALRYLVPTATGHWGVGWERGRTDLRENNAVQIGAARLPLGRDVQGESRQQYVYGAWQQPGWQLDSVVSRQHGSATQRNRLGVQAPLIDALLVDDSQRWAERRTRHQTGVALALPHDGWARLAYQNWQRPLYANALAPLLVAGVPLDARLVQPGGTLRRWFLQWQQPLAEQHFVQVYLDQQTVAHWAGANGQVLQTQTSISGLDKLRQRDLLAVLNPDTLEGTASFDRGRADTLGAGWNSTLSPAWSLAAHLRLNHSENTGANPGRRLPWIPQRQFGAGATWAGNDRWIVTVAGIWRAQRYADAANRIAVPADWTLRLQSYWETADKHWSVAALLDGLAAKTAERFGGVEVRYRY